MKKLIVLIVLLVFVSATVDANELPLPTPTGSPKPTESPKPTASPKISGVSGPKSGGTTTGTETETKPGGKQYNYVVSGDSVTIGDKTYTNGQTFTSDTELKDGKLTPISSDMKAFTDNNKGEYTYKDGTFSVTNEKFTDNVFEDYKTVTTTSWVKNPDGTYSKVETEKTYICGSSTDECKTTADGEKDWKEIKGSDIEKTTTYKDETVKGVTAPVKQSETRTIFNAKGTKIGAITVNYGPEDSYKTSSKQTVTGVTVTNGVPDKIVTKGPDGKPQLSANPAYKVYYSYDTKTGTVVNNIDDLPISNEEKNALRVEIVATGGLSFGAATKTLTWQQSLGRAIAGYYEYRGIQAFTNLVGWTNEEEIRAKQDALKQEFCLFAGISNCLTSLICENVYPLENADNILVGRGPGGQIVTSAILNAERSLPVEMEGLSRQQLIDMFGNSTVIKGRLINLTDPKFDPKALGIIRLRLYHVQYKLVNNGQCEGDNFWGKCDQEDMKYNIRFVRVPEEMNSSYGTPVAEAKWWTDKEPTLEYQASASDDLFKFSATEYSDVCLEFEPELPDTRGTGMSGTTDKLCVPFEEYTGGPTDIAGGSAPPESQATGPVTSATPGGTV